MNKAKSFWTKPEKWYSWNKEFLIQKFSKENQNNEYEKNKFNHIFMYCYFIYVCPVARNAHKPNGSRLL